VVNRAANGKVCYAAATADGVPAALCLVLVLCVAEVFAVGRIGEEQSP
jgi:hypothetical protein